jgi:hypothetical protein
MIVDSAQTRETNKQVLRRTFTDFYDAIDPNAEDRAKPVCYQRCLPLPQRQFHPRAAVSA